jgi:hypothetical protein
MAALYGAVASMMTGSGMAKIGNEMVIKTHRTPFLPGQGFSRRTMPHPRRFNGKRQWKARKMANNGNGVGRSA